VGFYQDRILPHLMNLAMRNRRLVPYRERVISATQGRVSKSASVRVESAISHVFGLLVRFT
jgi:hypothetical protein